MRSGSLTCCGLIALGLCGCAAEVHPLSDPGSDDLHTFGFVQGVLLRGSPVALRLITQPLQPGEGRSRVFDACKDELEAAAHRLGALSLEAVPAGPDRLLAGGYEGLVEVRIIYAGTLAYEVRHSVVKCRTDQRGQIIGLD